MKKFFKKLRKIKSVRITSKILLVFIILILLLGWVILFLMGNKGLEICYKGYNYGVNISNKVKICEEYKISINQKTYDKNDLLMEENNSINGIENGPFFYYYMGNLILKGQSIDGKLYGTIISYYYENGNIKEERNFEDGKLNGKYFEYYENGNLKIEGIYKNGEKIGTRTGYYETGNINYIENYKDGKLNGEYLEYYENGQIKEELNFVDGKKFGVQNSYLEDGYLRNEFTY